jgi:nucleoside-diphosphate-sugar epimerase
MVLGNGLVGKRFHSYSEEDQFLIFASGVSNSKTTNQEVYEREIKLLRQAVREHVDRSIIYFSTCSIYDPDEKNSEYVRHKQNIEEFIQANARQYNIFRVSNLAGNSSNPNTVLNFFYYHIKNDINFNLWIRACRNLIDIDDAYLIIDHILKNQLFPNQIVNIANPVNHPVKEIVAAIESFLNIKSNYIEIIKGNCFEIEISPMKQVADDLEIKFNPDYLDGLLRKYF